MSVPPVEEVTAEVVRRLQQMRKQRGLTLQEVYDATGIHVARLEAKKANMTVHTLVVLCHYYGTSLAEFFQEL